MTTYWLLGNRHPEPINPQYDEGDGPPACTSTASDNDYINPSITFQGPDSPAGLSWAQNVHLNNQEHDDDDDLQSQGACALPLNRPLRVNTMNEDTQDFANHLYHQENAIGENSNTSWVELHNERSDYQVVSSDDVIMDKNKEENKENSSQRGSGDEGNYESIHERERQINDNDNLMMPYDPTQVVSKGKVRATVIMFNRRWQNDKNSKKPNWERKTDGRENSFSFRSIHS